MAEQTMLNPKDVTATYRDGALTIRASGEEDGVKDIRVIQEKAELWPPIFAVVGDQTPAIGTASYNVERRFEIGREVDSIHLATSAGGRDVPVTRA